MHSEEVHLGDDRKDLIVGIEDRMSLKEYIIYGFQQVLVESSALTFPVATGLGLGLPKETIAYMVQAYLIGAGLVTITQSSRLLKLPCVQGPAAVFISVMITVGNTLGVAAAWTGMIIGAILSTLLSWPLGWWGKLRPIIAAPPVYGPLVTLIGLSLTGIVIGLIIGKPGTPNFGSGYNFFLAAVTFLIATVLTIYFKRGILRFGAILIAVGVGTIFAAVSGNVNFDSVGKAAWFGMPQLLPFGWEINTAAIVIVFVGYLIAIVESIGNYVLLGEVMGGQKMDEERINRGILGESVGSIVAGLIGGAGTTSYAQNIGAISITGIGSRHVITASGIIVLILGFIPKVGATVASIPPAVLGGIYILTWGMLIMQGIRVLGRMKLSNLNMIIAGTTFMTGMGAYFIPPQFLATLPPVGKAILSTGLIVGTIVGMTLFIVFKMILRVEEEGKSASTDNEAC
ncbi:Uric acid transporter UacT [Sporomusa rhizae]|uniref:uracil-xanthine permease family protein n=1 Tax=Sporomusa rhizae TaxID=357999 RepID=UPI00352AC00E